MLLREKDRMARRLRLSLIGLQQSRAPPASTFLIVASVPLHIGLQTLSFCLKLTNHLVMASASEPVPSLRTR